jgi:integrase/recombinase XerD
MRDTTLLGPWVCRFLLEHMVSERNLARNTQHSYRDALKLLISFAAKRLHKAVDRLAVVDLSANLVRLFLADLETARHCGIATRNKRLAAVRMLARFIAEHSPEHIKWCGQIRTIPFKKTGQPIIDYLEKSEMDALLAAPDRQTEQGQRDYAILLYLYNTGARATEAAQLKIGDMDLPASSVKITGKGNKERCCPLWPITVSVFTVLSRNRFRHDAAFLNRCGNPITRFGIYTLVERYVLKASASCPSLLKKRVSPHSIRHTTATHLLRAGVDIDTIRAWLGHVNLETTNIYADIDLETKARALAKCEVTEKTQPKGHWRDRPGLMEFLRTL